VHSLREFVEAGGHHPSIAAGLRSNLDATTGLDSPEYKDRLLRRETLRSALMNAMAREDLDAILYPHQMRLVVPIGEEQLERNGVLSNGTGFPAVAFPGGYSAPTDAAPLGVPIGVELLGPEWSEPELLMYAYAFQQATMLRRAPLSTPPRSSP
jgi:Asp-tRNA(Asn)/Glu-tRNA(Gln) amidotransferase A subunit family amidase